MKKPFVALLLLVGAAAMVASTAFAVVGDESDLGNKLVNAKQVQERLASRAQRLRTSSTQARPDSVWLGHSYTNHWSGTNNYWNIFTGVNLPGTGVANNAIWDWDHFTGYGPGSPANSGDSLEGWWPIRRFYNLTGGLTLADSDRPWWCLDYGNVTNYRMNAGAGGQRTKGVIGAWHGDAGRNIGTGVTWTPLSGTKSAWCGLRETNDNSYIDQVTKSPYNATTHEFMNVNGLAASGSGGISKNFPGYVDNWDQMLYRDITITQNTPVTVEFNYRTRLSTFVDTAPATMSGWFHGDPLAVTTGNFISATAATVANAPRDSFSVYLGVPTNATAVTHSDNATTGFTRPVWDPLRRWFSEVIRVFGPGNTYYELFSTAGSVPADTLSATPTSTTVVSAAQVNALIAAQGGGATGTARLVFRVKTNKDGSDGDSRAIGFTSRGHGAAIIDDVKINGVTIGDFELPEGNGTSPGTPNANAAIDNTTSTSAAQNWKSTGKPPATYFHVRNIAQLRYEDLCGPFDSPNRNCNIAGNVMSAGNRDDNEGAGDRRIFSDRERIDGMMSPTISLVTAGTPPFGGPNADVENEMGVSWTDANAWNLADDIYIWYDLYAGIFNLNFTGNAWIFGAQSYPARQANGGFGWGELRVPTFQIFNPEPQCFQDVENLYLYGLVSTVRPAPFAGGVGVPDSLRIFLGKNQQCFRFGVSTTCGANDGCYFDNVSVLFSNQFTGSAGADISIDIWQWWNDAFPANETLGLPGTAAFDTTTAWIKTGINNAPGATDQNRFDIAGDSTLVFADVTVGNRTMDLVFRILPGPGNYQIAAGRSFPPTAGMNLLQLPSNQTNVVSAGDNSFWGQYIGNNGAYGTPGGHFGGTRWDYLTWNSARCDTAERNIFPVGGKITTNLAGGAAANQWASILHEADPHYAVLGKLKNKCFLVDTLLAANHLNIVCNGSVPAWLTAVPQSRTGFDGQNQTREFTKIIPDGLLTPGSHVQYFYRVGDTTDPNAYATGPDTTLITPQASEGSTDGHRWQQIGILPDRWKDPAFGGSGMACMLYVDLNDRRGNERQFVSVMDSIGGTAASKYGAHNGWHAAGDYDISPDSPAVPDGAYVSNRNSQPGTIWDMYGVKGSESLTTSAGALGSRLSLRTPGSNLDGAWSRSGPTPTMLRTYYRVLSILSGDLTSGILGPIINRSQNDVALLNDFLTTPGGTAQPRGIFAGGDGFAYSETQTGQVPVFVAHLQLLTDKFGAELRNLNYTQVSGNGNTCIDLVTTPVTNSRGDVFGIGNTCLWSNDVLQKSTSDAGGEATEANFYENRGTNGPYVASIHHQGVGNLTRPWTTLIDGWDIEHIYGRYCASDAGRLQYYYQMFTTAFAGLNCGLSAGPLLDAPNSNVGRFVNFLKPTINNPLRSGFARVNFGLAKADRVEVRVYDVGSRLIRTLADRDFQAGEHSLTWDGTDDHGKQVARGVYFTQVHYKNVNYRSAQKVVVLK